MVKVEAIRACGDHGRLGIELRSSAIGRRNEALDTMTYALAARTAYRVRLDMGPKPTPKAPPPPALPPSGRFEPPEEPPEPTPPPPVQHRSRPVRRGRVIVRKQLFRTMSGMTTTTEINVKVTQEQNGLRRLVQWDGDPRRESQHGIFTKTIFRYGSSRDRDHRSWRPCVRVFRLHGDFPLVKTPIVGQQSTVASLRQIAAKLASGTNVNLLHIPAEASFPAPHGRGEAMGTLCPTIASTWLVWMDTFTTRFH